LDRITTKGKVSRIIDISASQGHIVPTSVDYFRGSFFVGNLTTFPLIEGAAKILATGLSLPIAMTFGPDGALYVSNKGFGYPPRMGEVVRISFDH
jgi:hypothetical protein